jgi:signal transduction histidine kinase
VKKLTLPKMLISLTLAVLAAVTLIFINEASFSQSTKALSQIETAQQTRSAISKLVAQMLNAETGQRGYLLTGDARYLAPYNTATADINQNLTQLHGQFTHDPQQLADFDVLSQHVARKLAEMDLTVRMRKQGNEAGWKFVLSTDVGNEQMEVIREQSARLVASNNWDMAQGQRQIKRTLLLARIGIAVTAVGAVLAFCIYLWQTKTRMDSGLREQESLEFERDLLETQVHERTTSLAELATHLQNVREDERGHLARELHDELGALLTAAKLDVARIRSRLGTSQPEATERLEHLIRTLNSGIALKRRIVEDLRPSSLSHLGLVASLEILAREFEERSGLSVSTELEQVELGGSAQLTVYRLAQESLTNIAKYANASQAQISLRNLDGYIAVMVKDNGQGFNPQHVDPSRHGLTGMRHRVEAAGGKLSIISTEGKGTEIGAILPKPM